MALEALPVRTREVVAFLAVNAVVVRWSFALCAVARARLADAFFWVVLRDAVGALVARLASVAVRGALLATSFTICVVLDFALCALSCATAPDAVRAALSAIPY